MKIDTSAWKEFKIGEIFPHIVKPRVFHAREVTQDPQGIPYVVRSKFNNGIKYLVTPPTDKPNPPHVISFGAENATFFYQKNSWISGRDMYYIDVSALNEYTCLFITACLQPIAAKYSYSFGLFPDLLRKEQICLPVTSNGQPDWLYMEEFMKRQETQLREKLSLLTVVINCRSHRPPVNNGSWKKFKITDIFNIHNTHSIVKTEVVFNSGDIPYVTASYLNNGIESYISYDRSKIDKGNSIMIGGKTMSMTYQDKDFFSNDSHNLTLTLTEKSENNKFIYLFLITTLQKTLSVKYSWLNSISKTTIKNDCINLPVTSAGYPDWDFMDQYMKNLAEKAESTLNLIHKQNTPC